MDAQAEGVFITTADVNDYIAEEKSPPNVYTRFFWHAIEDDTQNNILDWVKHKIFIEARTTTDEPKNLYGAHKRNQVDVKKLEKQLEDKGFKITHQEQGHGLSPYLGEDPHLFRDMLP